MSRARMLSIVLGFAALATSLWAQSANENSQPQVAGQKQLVTKPNQKDPLQRQLTEKEKQQRIKSQRQELSAADKDWLDHQVRYIISKEEEGAFLALSNEEERQT